MATIALYADKVRQMPGLIKNAKRSVSDYKSELSALRTKTLSINKSVCDLDDVIDSIQASSKTQEQKITSLETFHQNSEDFIEDAARIDGNVAEIVHKRKNDFYDKYNYLKPNCEKSCWEKFCDGCKTVGEWCKEHWKLIVSVVIVIAALACLLIPGLNALVAGLVFGKMLLAMAVGAIIGTAIGGIAGGTISALTGGSFWEGFENGAFSGAISGLISGGMGFQMSLLGKETLRLVQTMIIGGGSGVGTSLLNDLGDIFIKGENISFGEVLGNMVFSGVVGGALASISYGIAKGLGTLVNKSSWFAEVKELYRVGQTAKPNYGRITAYTTDAPRGISINFADGAGTSFRIEFDVSKYLHYHFPSMFGSKAHVPLLPMIDSALIQNILNAFARKRGGN